MNYDIKEIDKKTATAIIENREALGLYWLKENNKYIAIYNLTGDAWTEEFYTYKRCMEYLRDDGKLDELILDDLIKYKHFTDINLYLCDVFELGVKEYLSPNGISVEVNYEPLTNKLEEYGIELLYSNENIAILIQDHKAYKVKSTIINDMQYLHFNTLEKIE